MGPKVVFIPKECGDFWPPCASAGCFLPCTALWWPWGAIAFSHSLLSALRIPRLSCPWEEHLLSLGT